MSKNILKEERLKKRLSLEEVARKIGTSAMLANYYENKDDSIHINVLEKYAEALTVDLKTLSDTFDNIIYDNTEEFGQYLYNLRVKNGKTKSEIAKDIDISPITLYRYEKNITHTIDTNLIKKLINYWKDSRIGELINAYI